MIKAPGFTIIEAIISFFITILLVTQVFQFSAKFCSGLLERSKFNSVFLENYTAFDHIVRNLSQVSSNKDNFMDISDSQIIWRDDNKIDSGYIIKDNNLYFIIGSYKDGAWLTQRKNLLSSSTKEIKFLKIVDGDPNYIKAVNCTFVYEFKDKNYEFKRVIGLKNGIKY